MTKEDRFLWGCTLLREMVNEEVYGTVTLFIEKGCVTRVKKEANLLPPLDVNQKK